MRDFHRVLGVSRDARPDEIKQAYRRLARRHHPDMEGDEGGERFREIREAYEALCERVGHARGPAARIEIRCHEPEAWLADEVAIDFPSAGAIFERIRESFLLSNDPQLPLEAEIILTRDEAREGVTVPLDVPMRATCALCDGRGEVRWDLCHLCGGVGEAFRTHTVGLVVPPGIHHGARVRLRLSPLGAPTIVVDVRISVQ